MTLDPADRPATRGICLRTADAGAAAGDAARLLADLAALGLSPHVAAGPAEVHAGEVVQSFGLHPASPAWAAGHATLGLCDRLKLDTRHDDDLEREIWLTLLMSPLAFDFPSHAELAAAIRIRRNIVVAARKTALAFQTAAAERPDDCWTYLDGKGFVVRPGSPLIAALVKATQPDVSGRQYSFSCYRATEYVLLLAIAQELAGTHPALLAKLQSQWERRPIMSGQFHDVFLHEYGSMAAPLPAGYYVPGDRVWFRNPDAHSSDASGYEGSWVFYLGGGRFSNFWKPDAPFTLTHKCVEIHHWRHATFTDGDGELRIDERIVEARVAATLADARQTADVVDHMQRLRDPAGVYAEGGCIDTSREAPRRVCPATSDMVLPEH